MRKMSNSNAFWLFFCHHLRFAIHYDDLIKLKHFPRYWPFFRGIHRLPVDSPTKASDTELWCFFIRAWTNGWANNRDAGDLRRHRAHYYVTVITEAWTNWLSFAGGIFKCVFLNIIFTFDSKLIEICSGLESPIDHMSALVEIKLVDQPITWTNVCWLSSMTSYDVVWWRHQMETFSALLAICAGIHGSPVNSPHTGQWREALMFSLICVWINDWVNNREAGDLRRYRAHYDVPVMAHLTKDTFEKMLGNRFRGLALGYRQHGVNFHSKNNETLPCASSLNIMGVCQRCLLHTLQHPLCMTTSIHYQRFTGRYYHQ